MNEDVVRLLELQEIDSEIDRLKAEMDEIPRERQIHRRELEARERDFQKARNKLDEIRGRRAEAEKERDDTREKLAEFKNKLLEVKTNEAYRAMLGQIDYAEKAVGELESRMIELMYEEEEVEAELRDAEKVWEKNRKRFEKRNGILDDQLEELRVRFGELQERRKAAADLVTQRLLRRYEQLRSSGRALAVVGVNKGNCGGCLTGLPPQTVVEISQGTAFTCPICGRFVVWTDDSSSADSR